jgi:hypothetical protein
MLLVLIGSPKRNRTDETSIINLIRTINIIRTFLSSARLHFFTMFTLFFALFSLLAGRVLAQSNFTINIGSAIDPVNVSPTDAFNFTFAPVLSECQTNFTNANTLISACAAGTNDQACFCTPETYNAFYGAELCMLHTLIAQNKKAPDAKAGNNVFVGAYSTACNVSTYPAALTLPDNWVGPTTLVLPVPAAIVYVLVAGIFGVSALFILSNID